MNTSWKELKHDFPKLEYCTFKYLYKEYDGTDYIYTKYPLAISKNSLYILLNVSKIMFNDVHARRLVKTYKTLIFMCDLFKINDYRVVNIIQER